MINIFAPINNLGYGIHARGWIQGLWKWRQDLSLSVIGGIQAKLDENEVPIVQEMSKNSDKFNFKDPSLYIFHEQFGNCFVGDPMVTSPVFETSLLDKRSRNFLNQMGHVISVSKWGKETLEANEVKAPITVIPEGVDPNIFYPEPMSQDDDFTFVTVGKWEVRKSSQEILTAFTQEFDGSSDKIKLIAHMVNPFMGNDFINTVAGFLNELGYVVDRGADPKKPELKMTKGNLTVIVPMGPYQDKKDLARLYKRAHCGVFVPKAEGWNLPLMECLACGTPAIATYCTGQTEYLEAYEDVLMIKDLHKETANDGTWFKGNRGDWYTFNLDELKAKMRYAFDNRKEIRSIGSRYGEYIRREFSWSAAGKKLNEFFEGLKK